MSEHLDVLLIGVCALWGASAGRVLPRAAYRFSVPAGEEWRTACPAGHPVGGWLGPARCRACAGPPYGPRTAAVVVTALVCAALAAATGTRPELFVWLLLAPVGVLLATVDFRVQRLPDPLTLPAAAAALVLLGLTALAPEHAGSGPRPCSARSPSAPATSSSSSSIRAAWASAT
ncbi:hypothetical protein SHKM778_07090 [Streptomyces sp. KM77-8]|uniref:Prepilin peptidase n=1 Tax=Streptomyces haneummycinicus TaxID=3074435 RepID=A0AAT9HAI2_9ACTN